MALLFEENVTLLKPKTIATAPNHRRGLRVLLHTFLVLALGLSAAAAKPVLSQGNIRQDAERKLVTLSDGQGQLALRLNYDGRCILDQVVVRGREVAAESGVSQRY